MRTSLETRLRRLEAVQAPPMVVRIRSFVGEVGNVQSIDGPGGPWHRWPVESCDQLRDRAAAGALRVSAGKALVVLREINFDGAAVRDGRP